MDVLGSTLTHSSLIVRTRQSGGQSSQATARTTQKSTHRSRYTFRARNTFLSVNDDIAKYVAEFQGGSYDAWGPTAPGNGLCN